MKKTVLVSTIAVAATMSFAVPSSVRPESSVPTPAENAEISLEMPDLGAKESAEWLKLRDERRKAREQILMDLRNSTAAEKQNIRQEVSKKRDEMPRFEGDIPKNQPRERRPFYERSESAPMNPMRDMPDRPFEENRERR